MTKFNRTLIALGIALALPGAAAWAGVPYPTKNTPRAVDAGPVASDAITTVTIALKLHDAEGARALLTSMYTPGSPNFHGFLTPEQFAARFGPTADEIERVSASLTKFGLSVERAGTSTLHVTGTPSALESAFSVSLHTFSIAAHDHHPGYTYRAPTGAPAVPAEVASLVHGVIGLDTRPAYHPHMVRAIAKATSVKTIAPSSTAKATGNQPGSFTVADFANRYGVTSLYSQGIEGKGRTVGIVTLASFTPSDAFVYWSAVGLKVNSNRITVVNIDGGAGAPSDASGSDETTLDVEQSGGLAPAANVVVYVAPNTNQGFVDAFVKAVDANKADSISTSWGEWEWFDNLENSPVTDPFSGKTVGALHVQNEIFLQAALQGQSMFAAAGDSGAYDVNRFNLPPDFSLALSVDSPASDPYITATGGTTLPGPQTFLVGSQTITVDVKQERVWSWDYLEPLCQALNLDPINCGIFPVGGGGGVSVLWPMPFYQLGTQGTQRSQPDQAFVNDDVIPPQTIFALPAHYKGRNVPDISANADPDTGYSIYYTSDQEGFIIETFIGGTSFTAPQFNGVTALLDQSLHSRVGLLNIPLYMLGNQKGYGTSASSLKPVTTGNNDFYLGSDGYNPAAGLGTIDASKLATDLGKLFF